MNRWLWPPVLTLDNGHGEPEHWLGWQEWASLPDLGFDCLRVKVDTGARTSSLHAWEIRPGGGMTTGPDEEPTPLLRIRLDDPGGEPGATREIETPLVRHAVVTDSSGRRERRPVIQTRLILGPVSKLIEVNLTNREAMRFRMILGRTAVESDFKVDVNRSFILGMPERAHR